MTEVVNSLQVLQNEVIYTVCFVNFILFNILFQLILKTIILYLHFN